MCRKIFKELSEQARSNLREQGKKKLAMQFGTKSVKKKCFKHWIAKIHERIEEKGKTEKVKEMVEILLKRKYFGRLCKEYSLRQKFKMDDSLAKFKHYRRLCKSAFKSIAFYSIRKKLSKILDVKGKRMNWVRLATIGLSLFIRNTIQEKEKAGIYAKVLLSRDLVD